MERFNQEVHCVSTSQTPTINSERRKILPLNVEKYSLPSVQDCKDKDFKTEVQSRGATASLPSIKEKGPPWA